MKKYIYIFLTIIVCSCASTNKQIDSKYFITKIDYLDDGTPYIYVKNDKIAGIIIDDNDTLSLNNGTKIEEGKSYALNLKKIENNFRGETKKYALESTNGTYKIFWRKEDNVPLVLFEALNLKGLWIVEERSR
ncbi:MAG TPA: hypothetical protein VF676_02665 [Flavobacterium sp.]